MVTDALPSPAPIADGYNLVWKLRLVLTGVADASLLDTYSGERAPVGRQVVDRAFTSVGRVHGIGATIGLRPEMTEAEKWAAVRALDDATEEGARRRAALAEAMRLMDHNLNAHGVELGYRYAVPAAHDDTGDDRGTVDDLEHRPSTAPGAHLPHTWVEFNRRRTSDDGQAVQRRRAVHDLRPRLAAPTGIRSVNGRVCAASRTTAACSSAPTDTSRGAPAPARIRTPFSTPSPARSGFPPPQDGRAAVRTLATTAH